MTLHTLPQTWGISTLLTGIRTRTPFAYTWWRYSWHRPLCGRLRLGHFLLTPTQRTLTVVVWLYNDCYKILSWPLAVGKHVGCWADVSVINLFSTIFFFGLFSVVEYYFFFEEYNCVSCLKLLLFLHLLHPGEKLIYLLIFYTS